MFLVGAKHTAKKKDFRGKVHQQRPGVGAHSAARGVAVDASRRAIAEVAAVGAQ